MEKAAQISSTAALTSQTDDRNVAILSFFPRFDAKGL